MVFIIGSFIISSCNNLSRQDNAFVQITDSLHNKATQDSIHYKATQDSILVSDIITDSISQQQLNEAFITTEDSLFHNNSAIIEMHEKLNGRSAKSLQRPNDDFSEEGIVVVDIWVDKQGKVTRAGVATKGTTVHNNEIRRNTVEAALRSIFADDPNAPEEQHGTITYTFVINK